MSALVTLFHKGTNLRNVSTIYFIENKDCILNKNSKHECVIVILYVMQYIRKLASKYSYQLILLSYINSKIILLIILLIVLIRLFS